MSQDDFDQIRPADLQLNIDSEHGEPVPAPPRRTGVNAGIAIALTAALGAAAIILLPRLIGPSEQPVPAKVEQTSPPASPVATPAARPEAPNGLSPFEQAQRERERQLARDALDALLQLQFELEEQGAEQWAAEDYGAALSKRARAMRCTVPTISLRRQDTISAQPRCSPISQIHDPPVYNPSSNKDRAHWRPSRRMQQRPPSVWPC